MTTDTEHTTVRLPHTGLRAPDRSLTITAYKELTTDCGVAFTANLRVAGHIAGTVENSGRGGMTMFYCRDPKAFGEQHLDAYAAQCRTDDGGPVTAEHLLDEMVEEYDWARKVTAAQRRNRMQLRHMDASVDDFPAYATQEATAAAPVTEQHWQVLAKQVAEQMPAAGRGWWQGWTGTSWRDITPRPAGVSTELHY